MGKESGFTPASPLSQGPASSGDLPLPQSGASSQGRRLTLTQIETPVASLLRREAPLQRGRGAAHAQRQLPVARREPCARRPPPRAPETPRLSTSRCWSRLF